MKLKSCLALTLLWSCTGAMASGYIGIGYGETDYDADSISSFDDPDGLEIYAGFRSSEHLGFELGMVDFGEADDGIPPEWHLEAESLAISLLGIAAIGQRSEIFGQFGFHMWDAELSEDGFGVFAEDDGTDIFYGLGFRANVTKNVDLGIRYNVYDFDGDDVTRLNFNAQLGFN